MAIELHKNYIKVSSTKITLEELSAFAVEEPKKVKLAKLAENLGHAWYTSADDPDKSKEIMRDYLIAVCNYGGEMHRSSDILRANPIDRITNTFREMLTMMNNPIADIREAMRLINQLHYLEWPTYSSMCLRFMHPSIFPAFDKRYISTRIGYTYSRNGYSQYQAHLLSITQMLDNQAEKNPLRNSLANWYVADVDLALRNFARTELR